MGYCSPPLKTELLLRTAREKNTTTNLFCRICYLYNHNFSPKLLQKLLWFLVRGRGLRCGEEAMVYFLQVYFDDEYHRHA